MKKLSIILCLIWMSLIFYMSSQNGTVSNDKSYTILKAVKEEYKKGKALIKDETGSKTENIKNMPVKASIGASAVKSIKANELTGRDKKLNVFIRKNAHIFLYLVLAALVSNALFTYNYRGKSALVYIMFLCLLYAVLDEFHQRFTGRSSLVSDVLIDFSGSLLGMALFYLAYYKIYRKRKS